jgi:uncharacterized membrane protein (UPF0127 family)
MGFLSLCFATVVAVATAGPVPTPTPFVLHAPNAVLNLEIARTEEQREHGLMDRTSLPPHTGMVFVFEQDQPVEFWMKNTLIPLDMVFVAADGTVRSVAENVPAVTTNTPDEKIPRRDGNAQFVIELPAKEAAADGIKTGTHLNELRALVPAQ